MRANDARAPASRQGCVWNWARDRHQTTRAHAPRKLSSLNPHKQRTCALRSYGTEHARHHLHASCESCLCWKIDKNGCTVVLARHQLPGTVVMIKRVINNVHTLTAVYLIVL